MSAFFASRRAHAPDSDRRRIRLAERERAARELDWQQRRSLLPLI